MPALVFYALTAQREVQFWDVGEMQTVPWIFGIAHPTGFPVYVLLGWCFSHAFAFGSVAWRLSLLSVIATCFVGWCVYKTVAEKTGYRSIAVGSALVFDSTFLAWSRGTRADVHPVALGFEAAAILCLLSWRRNAAARVLYGGCAALGAALAVHLVALFALPSCALLIVAHTKRLTLPQVMRGAVAFLIPLLTYAIIPARSAQLFAERRDPTLRLGFGPGMPFWDYGHPSTWTNFTWFVSGAQFHREAGFEGYYKSAAFLNAMGQGFQFAHAQLGLTLLALATLGIVASIWSRRIDAVALVIATFAVVPFAFSYAEEADKERYLLLPVFALCCLVGFGGASLCRRFQAIRFASSVPALAPALVTVILLSFAGLHFSNGRSVVAINRDSVAARYVTRIMSLTPKNAIIVTSWIYATPLAYTAFVQHAFDDRIIVSTSVDAIYPRFFDWSVRRCVFFVSDSDKPDALETRLGAKLLSDTVPYIFSIGPCKPRNAL